MTRRAWHLMRDYAVLSAGELFAKIAGFAAFAYLARTLEPDAYGAVELAVALAMVFGLVVDFGFGPIGSREVTRDPSRASALVAGIPSARLLLALVAVASMSLCVSAMNQSREVKQVALLYALSLFAAPWVLNWLFQGLDMMRWVAFAQALRMTIFAAGVVLLVDGPEDLWKVGGAEIAAAFALAAYFIGVARWRAHQSPRLAFDPRALWRIGRQALPVGVSQLFWVLNQYLPTLLIATFAGAGQVALYGGAHRIVMSLGTFVWLYFFNLYPAIVRANQVGRGAFEDLARHSFRATGWLGILVALLASLLAEPICRLAYGDAFAPAAGSLLLLAWLLPINLLSGHARFSLIASGHQRLEMVAQAGGTVVTLALGLTLIPRFRAAGAALTMLATALVVWGIAHRCARRRVGQMPFASAALRPVAAAAGAAALYAVLPAGSPWLRGAAAAGFYVAAGPLLEPRLIRDLRSLARSVGSAAPAGGIRDVGR